MVRVFEKARNFSKRPVRETGKVSGAALPGGFAAPPAAHPIGVLPTSSERALAGWDADATSAPACFPEIAGAFEKIAVAKPGYKEPAPFDRRSSRSNRGTDK